jgi:hypothetical protein
MRIAGGGKLAAVPPPDIRHTAASGTLKQTPELRETLDSGSALHKVNRFPLPACFFLIPMPFSVMNLSRHCVPRIFCHAAPILATRLVSPYRYYLKRPSLYLSADPMFICARSFSSGACDSQVI